MEFLNQAISEHQIYEWEILLDDWIFLAMSAFLLFELVRLAVDKALTWDVMGDTVTNFVTLFAFIGIAFVLLGAFYVGTYYFIYEYYRLMTIPITPWSVALCVVLADLAYYWEHRFTHRVGVAWATHTVHHSSPYFNISVAYRFGPLDGFFPVFFHVPLVLAGFNPILVLFSEAVVQLYQTALHTEVIGKLPRPVEAVMNTPSHHRVHHGSNPRYLDKNYGGIFIVWDRLFGTFEEEKEPVKYGITNPLGTVNPFVVFFHGYARLARQVASGRSARARLGYLLRGPEWASEPDPAK
ncbi:MAG: sterol desaturase family protein [Gammaproteobacteria bacterium]|nr:sterol desaturase family protein [Gammaproteobacteria bacterium]MYH16800.1 sterol desaturase family protein [Gammaproteobacteria bacterium]MYK81731.1 sterol desaturase family protein [Gammaproteobacteria bacterium]